MRFKKIIIPALLLSWAATLSAGVDPNNSAPAKKTVVRVLVAENRKSIKVTVRGNYQIRLVPGLQIVKHGKGLAGVGLVPSPTGMKLGEDDWLCQGIIVEPAEDRDLYLDQSRFRGMVRILKGKDGLLMAINHINIESYLYGVLHHEVASWWPMEALKAQAIAARTYALYQVSVSRLAEFDLKSGTGSQMYGGSTTERYRTRKAVDETAGQILTYEGKIFPAYFHAACAGLTASAAELWKIDLTPISGGVECGYCRFSPHYEWQANVPLSLIEEKVRQNSQPIGQIIKIEIISQTPSHRVGSIRITGASQEIVLAAKDFRVWIGGDKLRSTSFTVQVTDDMALFRGKGWGHGVGLCQWGTLGQALLGRSHETILKFYYPGAALAHI